MALKKMSVFQALSEMNDRYHMLNYSYERSTVREIDDIKHAA